MELVTSRNASMIKKLILLVVAISLMMLISPHFTQRTSALSGSQFDAGRIIDDYVFYNPDVMSAQQIQEFLNSKVPVCDTYGSQPYGGTTRAAYGTSRGYPPPFICLKDYSQDIPSVVNGGSDLCKSSITAGRKTAAQIIFDVAQACKVSPKVLIVLLQKEQSLVTDDWPWSVQYRSATGYGCPDTAPCDSEYYGFFNQVYQAAKAYQRYRANPANYNYRAGRNNTILWHPNSSCGSSTVYIQNQATAGLYIYTPYRPNQAALNNLYGTGDSCSSYGNRNLWRMYNDWFGPPHGPPFAWEVVSNRLYDIQKSAEIDPSRLRKGERVFVSLKVRNVGTEIWYKNGPNPANLATVQPYNHVSPYCDTTWPSCHRPARIKEEVVMPGQDGHFEFIITVPDAVGEHRGFFAPVLEGRSWMHNDTGYHVYLKSNPEYAWDWGSYGAWANESRTVPVNIADLQTNQPVYITLYARNSSATIWKKTTPYPVTLGTSSPKDRQSPLCTPNWISCNRVALMNEESVVPGRTASFSFAIKAPPTVGETREFLRPLAEFNSWMHEDFHHIYLRTTR